MRSDGNHVDAEDSVRKSGISEKFHGDPVYGGDLHRAHMAWAKHAAGSGLTLEQIKEALLDGRDLSKKAAANVSSNTPNGRPVKRSRKCNDLKLPSVASFLSLIMCFLLDYLPPFRQGGWGRAFAYYRFDLQVSHSSN